MGELIRSSVFDKLASILGEKIEGGVRSVMGDGEEACKFIANVLSVQHDVQLLLGDAECRQLNDKDVEVWLTKFKDTLYDIYDVLDECNTAVGRIENEASTRRTVCSFITSTSNSCLSHCKHLVLRFDVAFRIAKLNKNLDFVKKEKDDFHFNLRNATRVVEQQEVNISSFIDMLSKAHGREKEKNDILSYLLGEGSDGPTLPIISLVGPGGMGKTTLARFVFNDKEVKAHFDKRVWVSVSSPCNDIGLAKAILKTLKDDAPNLDELEIVLQHIRRYIEGKKFLLVLDDFETNDLEHWEELGYSLKCASQGSRILVTARKEDDVKKIKTDFPTSLRPLPEDSWSIFVQVAFSETGMKEKERLELEKIGRNIVKKCHGLPLAVRILGCLLRFKRSIEEWQNIMDSEMWELKEVKEWELKEAKEGLLASLLLSYYDLPSRVRKCFLYCAMFPKNYEIEKDRLIKLWMSQSYLKVEGNEDMELIGEKYFENLVMHSFFQDFHGNEYDGSIRFKMHDLVHYFVQLLAKNECSVMEGFENSKSESSCENVKHSTVLFESEGSFPVRVYKERKLRSLVVEPRGGFMSEIDLPKLFDQLTCLRTLDLSNHGNIWFNVIKEVPRGIKNLTHLRYLNFSKNKKIRELPEALCELYNLQTLELSWCINLKNLPQGIGKLINLRHIVNYETSLSYMPKGIERLTYLRTLSEFVVSCGGNGSKASTIGWLRNLNHLQSLSIKKLGNVTNVNEFEIAKFRNKEKLSKLSISFENDEEKGRKNEDAEIALEKLQLPPNLERLKIFYYRGETIFSSWIMLLTKLKLISLDRCMNFKLLPPLGILPSLESLIIRSMRSLERVDNEFLGIQSAGILPSTSVIAFPKLKYLEFQKMKEWKEWDYMLTSSNGEDIDITIMPNLRSLIIGFCPQLTKLPDHTSPITTLEELKIVSCSQLKENYNKRTEDTWLKFSNVKFDQD